MSKIRVAEVDGGSITDVDKKSEADKIRASAFSIISGKDGFVIPVFDDNDNAVSTNFQIQASSSPSMSVVGFDGLAVFRNGHTLGNSKITSSQKATISIDPSDPLLGRIDLVTIAGDIDSGSGLKLSGPDVKQKNFVVTKGTPALGPVAPSTPQDHLCVAKVFVRPGATSITASDIADCRNFLPTYPETVGAVSSLSDSVSSISTDLSTLEGRVTSLEAALTSQISSFNTAVSALSSTDNALQAQIDGLTSDIGQLQTGLTSIATAVSGNTVSISDITDRLSPSGDIGSKLLDLMMRLDSASLEITNLTTNQASITGDVAALQTAFDSLNTTVASIISDVVTASGDILNLQSTTTDHENRISTLESAPPVPPGIQTTLDDLQAQIDSIGTVAVPQDDVVTDTVDLGDVDIVTSDFGLSSGCFTLDAATTGSPVVFSDNFDTADGPLDASKWGSVVGASIKTLQAEFSGVGSVDPRIDLAVSQFISGGPGIGHELDFDYVSSTFAAGDAFRSKLGGFLTVEDPGVRSQQVGMWIFGTDVSRNFRIVTWETGVGFVNQSVQVPSFNSSLFPLHVHAEIMGGMWVYTITDKDGNGLLSVSGSFTTAPIDSSTARSKFSIGRTALSQTGGAGNVDVIDNVSFKQKGAGLITSFDTTATVNTKPGFITSVDAIRKFQVSADIQIPTSVGTIPTPNLLVDLQFDGTEDLSTSFGATGNANVQVNGFGSLEWLPTWDDVDATSRVDLLPVFDLSTMTLPRTYEFVIQPIGAGIAAFIGFTRSDGQLNGILYAGNSGHRIPSTLPLATGNGFVLARQNATIIRTEILSPTTYQTSMYLSDGVTLVGQSQALPLPADTDRVSIMGFGVSVTDLRISSLKVSETTPLITKLGDVTVDVSLDGGANYINDVAVGSLLDGTAAPFNGVGNDPVLRFNLSTTDPTVTPKICNASITTVRGLTAGDFDLLKNKINEIVTSLDQFISDYNDVTPIQPTTASSVVAIP